MNDGRGGRRGSGSRRGFHFGGCCWVAQFSGYLLRAFNRRICHWAVRSEGGKKRGSCLGSYPVDGAVVHLDIPSIAQGLFISHHCIHGISTRIVLSPSSPWNLLINWIYIRHLKRRAWGQRAGWARHHE